MNEPNEAEREKLNRIVKAHVDQLGEHFDSVQIMCSNLEQGGEFTAKYASGSGNWYARVGMTREWLMYHDEQMKQKARKDSESDV